MENSGKEDLKKTPPASWHHSRQQIHSDMKDAVAAKADKRRSAFLHNDTSRIASLLSVETDQFSPVEDVVVLYVLVLYSIVPTYCTCLVLYCMLSKWQLPDKQRLHQAAPDPEVHPGDNPDGDGDRHRRHLQHRRHPGALLRGLPHLRRGGGLLGGKGDRGHGQREEEGEKGKLGQKAQRSLSSQDASHVFECHSNPV